MPAPLLTAWLLTVMAAPRLNWEAPDQACPDTTQFVEATEAYLGQPLAAYTLDLEAWVRVREQWGTYTVELRINQARVEEQHLLDGANCSELAQKAALLIASAVDPFALGPRRTTHAQPALPRFEQDPRTVPIQRPSLQNEAERRPTHPTSSAPVSPAPAARAPVPAPDPQFDSTNSRPSTDRSRPSWPDAPLTGTLSAAGTGFVGLFPTLGGGVEVEGAVERGRFRWQLGASGWFGGRFRAPETDRGGDFTGGTGQTGLCFAPSLGPLRIPLCAVAGVGVLSGEAVNTIEGLRQTQTWAYGGIDLRANWRPRPHVGLFVGLGVVASFRRPAWSLNNPPVIYRVAPATGILRLGIELHGLGKPGSRSK